MNIWYTIREQLKQGATIHEICKEYNITFKYLMNNINKADKKPRYTYKKKKKVKNTTKTVSPYISEQNGRYTIRKSINNKLRSFGVYYTLEDAEQIRDYCIKHGWKRGYIDIYCHRLGIIRIKHSKGREIKPIIKPNNEEIQEIQKIYGEIVKPRLEQGEAFSVILRKQHITGGIRYNLLRQYAIDDGYKLRVNGYLRKDGERVGSN